MTAARFVNLALIGFAAGLALTVIFMRVAAKGWDRSYLTDGERAAILDAIKSAYELGKAAADEAKES